LGLSIMTLTVIFAVYVVGLLGALLTVGSLSDHLGRRPMAAVYGLGLVPAERVGQASLATVSIDDTAEASGQSGRRLSMPSVPAVRHRAEQRVGGAGRDRPKSRSAASDRPTHGGTPQAGCP
jgi:hypothetical protein